MGSNLRAIIKKKGLSFTEAAKEIGISLSYLNQLMNGEKEPSLETVKNICATLDIWSCDLIEGGHRDEVTLSDLARILESRLPEPAPAPIPINQAELDRLKAQVQELTEKLQEKERLIGPHALLLKELKKARPAQVASAYAPFPGLEVPEGVIGEDK